MLDTSRTKHRDSSEGLDGPSTVHFGPFSFERERHVLHRDGDEVELPERSRAVLEMLLRSPGRTVSRDALIRVVWRGAFVSDTSLTEAVSRLRQALGDGARQPSYVQTVHGRGYKFIAPLDNSVSLSTLDDSAPLSGVERATPRRGWIRVAIAAALFLSAVAWIGGGRSEPGPLESRVAVVSEPAEGFVEQEKALRSLYRLSEVTLDGEVRRPYGFPPLPLEDLSVDPVSGRLAFSMSRGEGSEIWMLHPQRGMLQRIASGGHFSDPVWTPDGRGLALAHTRSHGIDLMYGEPGSGQEMEVLLEAPYDQFPESWSGNGQSLVYSEQHPETGFDLWLLRQQDGRWTPTPLVRTEKQEAFGAISPNGRYVAYVSQSDTERVVYALDLHRQRDRFKVSGRGGHSPFWSASGDRLHYVEQGRVWTVQAEQLESGAEPASRRATRVSGVRLAAASSASDRFVVAVLDGTSRADR